MSERKRSSTSLAVLAVVVVLVVAIGIWYMTYFTKAWPVEPAKAIPGVYRQVAAIVALIVLFVGLYLYSKRRKK